MLNSFSMKPLAVGALVLAPALVLVQPAEAATFIGTIGGSGNATIADDGSFFTGIEFSNPGTVTAVSPGLSSTPLSNLLNATANFQNVAFDPGTSVSVGDSGTTTFTTTNPFIEFFDTSNTLLGRFVMAPASGDVSIVTNQFGLTSATLDNFSGTFEDGLGNFIGKGQLTAQVGDTFSFGVAAQVPEPITMLGTAAAIAIGAGLKRRHDQGKDA